MNNVPVSAIVFSFYECTKRLLPATSFRNRGVVALLGNDPALENETMDKVSIL